MAEGWLSLFEVAHRDFLSAKGRGNVCQGVAVGEYSGEKEDWGEVGKYVGRIQISLRRRTKGGTEKLFGTRQQETSKSVPFPPSEYKWNTVRTDAARRLYRFLVDTKQFARDTLIVINKKGKAAFLNARKEYTKII